ncbi:DUF2794 domain-containing protein [Roseibium litorale]|uniref:DUF2794 domain-containing protein n=1 Tax=Roseibium litorale TaxID=2803841 RepID=A0ABR9CN54_9HYPH|nr:DUF2794 domain-containing protein [Roseibium litorale]MBD8892143.1 DUF2794 domain-containing protein [Roseibium litorale]
MSETEDGAGDGASLIEVCGAPAGAAPSARPSSLNTAAPVSPAGPQANSQPVKAIVSFNRRELDVILRLYGRMVAEGEWRDYAIDLLKDRAVFSVFRRTSEMPLYRIEKDPKLARKQGAYSVVAAGGMILKRGQDLVQVLKVLEKKKHLRLVDV